MALFLAILVYHALVHVINIDRPSCFYATLYPHGEKTCFQGFRVTRKPVCLATKTSKILKVMNRQLQIVYVFTLIHQRNHSIVLSTLPSYSGHLSLMESRIRKQNSGISKSVSIFSGKDHMRISTSIYI